MATQQTATMTASISEKPSTLPKKGDQEAGVVVEDEIGRVEAGRVALEERHRDHRRKRHDEEHDQHQAGKNSGV